MSEISVWWISVFTVGYPYIWNLILGCKPTPPLWGFCFRSSKIEFTYGYIYYALFRQTTLVMKCNPTAPYDDT